MLIIGEWIKAKKLVIAREELLIHVQFLKLLVSSLEQFTSVGRGKLTAMTLMNLHSASTVLISNSLTRFGLEGCGFISPTSVIWLSSLLKMDNFLILSLDVSERFFGVSRSHEALTRITTSNAGTHSVFEILTLKAYL